MSETLTPDICIVGAGSGGLTLAAAAAAFGVSVVLVEKDRMGGDCLNTGCVPSKALIAAAARAEAVRRANRFGIRAAEPDVDFQAVMAHVQGAIAAIAPNDSAERFGGLGVTVLRGHARFRDRRTMVVGATEIRARRFVVATGSRPAVPSIPQLDTVPYLTNETVFELTRRPSRLVVVGGGPVGLELAQAFRRLGSAVTVLEAGRALAAADPEIAALVLESLRREGVEIREGVSVGRIVRRGRTGVRVTIGEGTAAETIDASHLLVAAGRLPNVEDLGLEQAGISVGGKGIVVDRRLRTTNRRVHAVGDVAGGPQFTHWAGYQAGQVLRSILFRFGGAVRPEILPWAIFTDPEIAQVGLSEADARRRHRDIRILRWPFSENDRARTEGDTNGLVKIVADEKGRILGATIMGREASELIAPLALAVAGGASLRSLATAVLPYPTRAEALRRAAVEFYAPKLGSPLLRRLVGLLGRLP